MIFVRTLRPDEPMPQHMNTGFEQMEVMKDFVWIAEEDNKIVGSLLASPCHGLIFFVRLRVVDDASTMTVPLLFRHAIRDCTKRGFKGYFTYVDPSLDAERRFIPICQKAGGIQVTAIQVGLVGSLEKAARY